MRKLGLLSLLALGFSLSVSAQQTETIKFPGLDKSPLDVVYYPLNVTKSKEAIQPVLRILYSRPQKNGRDIFGVLEPFGKVWRLGANENAELQVFKQISIAGKKIKPGRYSLFSIPDKEKWAFIVNKQVDRWGAFSYDEKQDVVKIDLPVEQLSKTVEALSMTFKDTNEGANLIVAWDNTQVVLPISFKK